MLQPKVTSPARVSRPRKGSIEQLGVRLSFCWSQMKLTRCARPGVGEDHQRRLRPDFRAQGHDPAAHVLVDLLVGGVVGGADLAVAAGVAEEQRHRPAQPAPAQRLALDALEVVQLAGVQYAGPVQALEGHLAGFRAETSAQRRHQFAGVAVQTVLVAAIGLVADAVDQRYGQFHAGSFSSVAAQSSACRRSPSRPPSTSSRNSSPSLRLSAIAWRQ